MLIPWSLAATTSPGLVRHARTFTGLSAGE
jgi:hypothetical protein